MIVREKNRFIGRRQRSVQSQEQSCIVQRQALELRRRPVRAKRGQQVQTSTQLRRVGIHRPLCKRIGLNQVCHHSLIRKIQEDLTEEFECDTIKRDVANESGMSSGHGLQGLGVGDWGGLGIGLVRVSVRTQHQVGAGLTRRHQGINL